MRYTTFVKVKTHHQRYTLPLLSSTDKAAYILEEAVLQLPQ